MPRLAIPAVSQAFTLAESAVRRKRACIALTGAVPGVARDPL